MYVVEKSRKWSANFFWDKALVIIEKVGITHTSLVPYKYTRILFLMHFHHLMSPALFFHSTEALGFAHLFHLSLPKSLNHHCMWWKNHTPNQGNRCESHKQLYQNPLQLSSTSLGYTQAERCRPLGLKGHKNLLPIKLST